MTTAHRPPPAMVGELTVGEAYAALHELQVVLTRAAALLAATVRGSTHPAAFAAHGLLDDARHTAAETAAGLTASYRRAQLAAMRETARRAGFGACVLAVLWLLPVPRALTVTAVAGSAVLTLFTVVPFLIPAARWVQGPSTVRLVAARVTATGHRTHVDGRGAGGVAAVDQVLAAVAVSIDEIRKYSDGLLPRLVTDPASDTLLVPAPIAPDRQWRTPVRLLLDATLPASLAAADEQIRIYRTALNVRATCHITVPPARELS